MFFTNTCTCMIQKLYQDVELYSWLESSLFAFPSSFSPTPLHPPLIWFFFTISFACSRTSHKWGYIVCTLFGKVFSLSVMFLRFFLVYTSNFFLLLCFPLYDYAIINALSCWGPPGLLAVGCYEPSCTNFFCWTDVFLLLNTWKWNDWVIG